MKFDNSSEAENSILKIDTDAVLTIASTAQNRFYSYFRPAATQALATSLMKYVESVAITSVSWETFKGEALEYMQVNQIPYSDEGLYEFANSMYSAFCANAKSLIEVDLETGELKISPFILRMEFGDHYMPALQIISRAMAEVFSQ